ncbi:hypothetical protein [Burkholderia pyrrocinia]|uniref:hypothetical protein n=1 Tax=Burkholderia pyrrocinia TaxID=60550 RepID=UPI00158A7CE7|nr:hypothetical protein [Burkholderia pyrrocinia]
MIESAEEFIALRDSLVKDEYDRSTTDSASASVWRDVIARYPDYRKWVAHNKTVPLEILEELCQFDADVRYCVAIKRKLSMEMFERLSKDSSPLVRQGIASNKKAPISIINGLTLDDDEDVARVARYNAENR